MAMEFVDTDGTLVIPAAYAKWVTAPSNAGIATRGVIVLLGEADMGPAAVEEPNDLAAAIFGPGQFSQAQAKYGSGPLVDAFYIAANPSRDPAVTGAPTQIICVKTNVGTKAQGAFSGGYAVAQALQAGALGNLISVQVTAAAADVPPVLPLSFIHLTAAETVAVSASGGTPVTLVVTDITPAAFVATNTAALAAQNITLAGGVAYQPGSGLVGVTATLTAAGNVITIALAGGTWASQPRVGEVLVIGNASSLTGAGNANSGQYIVSSSTVSGLVATKYIDANGSTLTPPVNVAPGAAVVAGTMDAYTIITFTATPVQVAGHGDSLSFYRSAGPGSHFFSETTQVTTSLFTASTTEASATILVNRRSDGLAETLTGGGNVALTIGHVGATTAPVIISATYISLNGFLITKAQFKTLGDVVAYINAQSGWVAAVPAAFAQLSPSVLDFGTYEANQNSYVGTMPARIKKDAYDISKVVSTSNGISFVVAPTAGLPAVQGVFFLSGGTRGITTDAGVAAALVQAGLTRCNFVVPLFSQDATADIALGVTDPSSTYTIDGINAYVVAHVLQFSQFKKRRPRQAFVSKRTTLALAKTAAQTLANFRTYMSFLDVSASGQNGLQWFQPWMGSVLAAGMQAAGFYRPIFNKSIACNGVRQAAGDFSMQDDDAIESALLAGLGVIRLRDGGGFSFVSDQTTYGTDDNFVLNSVQACYIADIIAQTTAQRMERAFVGQSFADITAGAAMSFLKGIMADLKRLKLIAASDDAVDGYKDARIEIRPPAMLVSATVKAATGLYYIPIKFLVSQVQQTASQG